MNKIDWKILFYIITLLIGVGFICFQIYLLATYGDKPIDEVPAWVTWLMIGGK